MSGRGANAPFTKGEKYNRTFLSFPPGPLQGIRSEDLALYPSISLSNSKCLVGALTLLSPKVKNIIEHSSRFLRGPYRASGVRIWPFIRLYHFLTASVWSGREDLNLRPPAPEAGALAPALRPDILNCLNNTFNHKNSPQEKFIWSGRPDLNRRPLAPQASALVHCATPRHF